jgi:hypothetical protein
MKHLPPFPPPHVTGARRLRMAGTLVLVIGWLLAAAIGFGAAGGSSEDEVGAREASALARLGGTANVRTVKLDHWLSSLWHGERLAWTIAVLSLVVCAGCFHVAGLMAEDVGQEPRS